MAQDYAIEAGVKATWASIPSCGHTGNVDFCRVAPACAPFAPGGIPWSLYHVRNVGAGFKPAPPCDIDRLSDLFVLFQSELGIILKSNQKRLLQNFLFTTIVILSTAKNLTF